MTPNTLEFISNKKDPIKYLKQILQKINLREKVPIVISTDSIDLFNDIETELTPQINSEINKKTVIDDNSVPDLSLNVEDILQDKNKVSKEINDEINPFNKTHLPNIEILEDPTGRLIGTGKVEDFVSYFKNRYLKLKKILNKQVFKQAVIPIKDIGKRSKEIVHVIAMIRDLTKTNSGHYILELEDPTGTIQAGAYNNNEELMKKMEHLLLDQVVGIKAYVNESKTKIKISVQDVIWPNMPLKRKIELPNFPIFAALISDTHFGSKEFMKEEFKKFIEWLKGDVKDSRNKYISDRVKYVVFAGDVVDGVGVYPSQKDDLEILDIRDQYDYAAKWLSQIPEHIHVIIIPGGAHDAIRRAMPHPAIPRKYAPNLYKLKNVTMLGNPAFFKLESVKFLVTHGDSFDDLVSSIPQLSYEKTTQAMIEMLRCRHIAPIYGLKTGIAPEIEDHLVIERIPDVFHTGHSHVLDINSYRNTLLVNSGCFQAQTSFMKEKGITPKPALVPIVNLQTLEVTVMDFN